MTVLHREQYAVRLINSKTELYLSTAATYRIG
jgi:hypothetical protein